MVTTRVVDTFAAVRPTLSAILTEQTARELLRADRMLTGLGHRVEYVVALDPAPCGFLPVYLGPDETQLGSVGTMPTWTAIRGPARTGTAQALFATGLARAAEGGATRVTAPLLHDDLVEGVRAAAAEAMPTARLALLPTHEGVIDVTFSSFDGYVDSLPARQRMVRRQRRRFLESGLTVVDRNLSDACGELAPLLYQVDAKYGDHRPVAEYETYLWNVGASMGRHGRTLVALEDGDPVAFSVIWDQGDGWRMRFWGCDYDRPVVREAYVYFNLVFYEPITLAARSGAECVRFGTESLSTKQERGARLHPLTTAELT